MSFLSGSCLDKKKLSPKTVSAFFLSLLFLLFSSRVSAEMTLKIWDFPRWLEAGQSTDRFTWITGTIKEFEAAHPGVRVALTKLT